MGIERRCAEKNIKVVKIYNHEDGSYSEKLKKLDGMILVGDFSVEEADRLQESTLPLSLWIPRRIRIDMILSYRI